MSRGYWKRVTCRDLTWGVVPPGFKKVRDGRGGLMIVREDIEQFFSLAECARGNDRYDPGLIGFQGRARLTALKLRNGDTALIRPYRHGGLFRHLLRGIFFTWPPRPFRELAITEEVRRRGIPTVAVLAACVKRIWGPFYCGWLVTRQLEGSQDLWAVIRDDFVRQTGAEKVFSAVADSLRRLHRAGIYHRDLNLKNILVRCETDAVKGYIIDFDRAELFLGEVPMILVQRNLDRLLRSAMKLDPKREVLSARAWKRFVDAYHGNDAGEP